MQYVLIVLGCGLGLFFVYLTIAAYGYFNDLNDWNGGRCRKHGLPWISFDVDSSGARGYSCRRHPEDCTAWISFPVEGPKPAQAVWYVLGAAAGLSVMSMLYLGILIGISASRG